VNKYVLDASALLAFVWQEAGGEEVAKAAIEGAAISAVNLSEVVAKLSQANVAESVIRREIDLLQLEVVHFDTELACRAGVFRAATAYAGLSLGDRVCLALAEQLGVPALTTDRAWQRLPLDIAVQVIR
jgi:PIN domain nuclease of toxin-antitoxin system